MACFHPIAAFQEFPGAPLRFLDKTERATQFDYAGREFSIPCGRCIGCRLVRTRSWAIRCMHEAQMHEFNSFVTLTYDSEHYSPSLNYSDFQQFMYRLRSNVGPTRFFMCGEYGDQTLRPHFHVLFFGRAFRDGPSVGKNIITSRILSKLWTNGFNSVGDVSYDSAAYVARYACKKVTGDRARSHYCRVDIRTGEYVQVVPEFGRMSLRPGIGYTWFQKFWKEVYGPRDGIVRPGGLEVPPPRYYDKLLLEMDSDLREYKDFQRYVRSGAFAADCTVARLADREKCALAKARFLRRKL